MEAEEICLLAKSLAFCEAFGQCDLSVTEVVEDIAEKSSIAVDEQATLIRLKTESKNQTLGLI